MALKKKQEQKSEPRKFIKSVKQIFKEAEEQGDGVPRTTEGQVKLLREAILGPKKKKSLFTKAQK